MSIFTAGDYTAIVTNDNFVEIRHMDVVIDRPGPWADNESATTWAEAIVGKWSVTGHESDMNGER